MSTCPTCNEELVVVAEHMDIHPSTGMELCAVAQEAEQARILEVSPRSPLAPEEPIE